jgi:hypothetical protein
MLKEEEIEELEKNSNIISSFKILMSQKGVSLKDENFKYLQTIGIIATYSNIISFLHQNIKKDKEDLFDFKKLCQVFNKEKILSGYLIGENFMLMANSRFRRGFHLANNYSPRFIELFWNYDNVNIDTYISLDIDRVRINVDSSAYMEKDTWYGAKFNRSIDSISDGIVKLRPPLDIENYLISFLFNDSYALDIKWATKEGVKSFQLEEFKTEQIKVNINGILYFPVRYVHAEYDLNKNYFRHFDGAIHFYTEIEYYSRRDSDFNHNDKGQAHIKTLSEKLFKMNGQIDVSTWIEFISHYLTGNPLVFEYFEGSYPQHIYEMLEKVRLKNK